MALNLEVSYKSTETHTTPGLAQLTPKQRKCRFFTEATNPLDPPIYTLNLCRMRCRQWYAVRKCNCYPHFYGNLKVVGYSECDLEGLVCLSKHAEVLLKTKINCNCPQACTDVNYIRDTEQRQTLYVILVFS